MALIIKKKKGVITHEINSLAFVNLLVAIGTASVTTIWALYIDSFFNKASTTSLISSLLALISIVSYFIFVPLIEKSNKGKLFNLILLFLTLTYILLSINKSLIFFLILSIILTSLYTMRISTFGIILKDKSTKNKIAKNEGLIFTFLNSGWLIGPLIAGFISSLFGLRSVFALSSIFILSAAIVFKISKIKDKHIQKRLDTNIFLNLIEFFKDPKRTRAYFIDGISTSWWVLIYLFMPLLMKQHGFNEKTISLFLLAVAIPLILTEYKFSKLVEKTGFKKIFGMGFLILSICSFIAFFLTNIYMIIFVIIIASFGMAMLEPTSQAYFLIITKRFQINRFYGPFNTTRDINQFIAKIIPSLILLILPFKFIFIFFGIIMTIMFFIILKIKI